ncbi:MAG TPA: alanine racemase [Solirubrobacteraceae bacterium]|nr:alanine racemase [Solirubrobacteraceae bacterium]
MFQLDAPDATQPLAAPPPSALPHAIARTAASLGGPAADAAFLYAPSIAANRAARLRAVLPGWVEIAYAVKANAFEPVVAALAAEVDGFDVSSAGELQVVRAVPPCDRQLRLVAAGPGKTPALLEALIDAGADPINVESALEVERVAAGARRSNRRVTIALRVNPAHVALDGALRMGGGAAQFGIPEEDLGEVVALTRRHPELDVLGFHVHAVCGNLDAATHVAYVRWCLDFSRATAAVHGIDLRIVNAGGGLGVAFDGGPEFDVAAFGRGLHALDPPAGTRLIVEPGRWLAAPCGWYAAPVTDLKHSRGTWFAVLRGGIHHFALPASWDLVHRVCVVPVERWDATIARPELRRAAVTVVGELCTPEDTLARDVAVERLRAGDVVVFPDAGSYGWEFALQRFLGHPPARRIVVGAASTPWKEPR